MSDSTTAKLINFLWFQTIWVLAIFTRYDYLWLIGLLLVAFFCVARRPGLDALVALSVAALGSVLDSLLTLSGVFVFQNHMGLLPVPVWLVALWGGFALTLRHSLNYLQGRWLLAGALAAVSGPASYYAGLRFGAVEFGYSVLTTLLLLAGLWALVLPAMYKLVAVIERNRPLSHEPDPHIEKQETQ